MAWPGLPLPLRAGLGAACLLVGVVLALVRPGGRPLEQWGLASLAYLAAPRRTTWSVVQPRLADWRPSVASGWIELAPELAWASALDDHVAGEPEEVRWTGDRQASAQGCGAPGSRRVHQ